jgi:EpsI family protein
MEKFKTRYLIVLSLLLLTSIYVLFNFFSSSQSLLAEVEEIPLSIANWSGEKIAIDKEIFDILGTNSVIMREYKSKEGQIVWLSIVYYPDNRVGFHHPESCYGGVGYTIIDDRVEAIKIQGKKPCIIQAKILHYRRNDKEKLIIYFFEAKDFITSSYLKLRKRMMLNQIKFKRHSGAMVRFSIPILHGNTDEAFTILKKFMSQVVPLLPQYLP